MGKFPSKTRRNSSCLLLKESFEQSQGEAKKEGSGIWIAGRIVGILDDGFVLQDESGRLDLRCGEKVRVGDIVEVRAGGLFEVGGDGKERAVFVAREVAVLVQCVDDFFIKPDDPNYRRAVIDLSFMERMKKRARVIDGIREFFKGQDFLEASTPEIVRLPGMEPYLDIFKTRFTDTKGAVEDLYLITSPEYAMKKLLVSGCEKIFQICRSFRNKETNSSLHNPEFTLLEWYRAFADYENIMKDTENLVAYLAKKVCGGTKILFQGHTVDVSTPWPRVKVKDLFAEYAGIDAETFEDEEKLRIATKKRGYKVDGGTSYDNLFFSIFMNEIEPKLGFNKPVIAYEYPACMAALAKKCADNPAYAQRFEVYMAGVELCNAFTELNDPREQERRLEAEREERIRMGKEDYPIDQSFIRALEFGMPPSGGNALGVDRLVMLLTDTPDIRDILFFPHKDL
ncbi:EF-P lysine aminoacylase GenX [Patescibacteria group bacterium]|nr:EF-P lysine aminoacylase GenX [Patescibacteria group bacterium]MBU1703465.1 EF-P lysine aminoacylase GenX [Patescibacteria group bacterium]MBU1953453.1 EF-P lysine aminoacylase GenX [Patescibacteria group bacterium]